MAIDFPVGTDFPANGNQIPDGEVYEGFYWDAATGAWKRVCDRDRIGDCLDDDTGETVCDKIKDLELNIIELEEEIDAIATSTDRGTWEWAFSVNNYLDPLPPGKFYMVRESDLAVVTEYKECGRVIFHEDDLENDNHVFNKDLIDKILMLFDRPDDDFIESVITDVEETTSVTGITYIIHVDRRQSEGSPTNAPDAEGKYKARLNIFDQPSGGAAGDYVLKAGDTMTGNLQFKKDPVVNDVNSPGIKFECKNSGGATKQAQLYLQPSGYIYSANSFSTAGSFDANSTSCLKYKNSTIFGATKQNSIQYWYLAGDNQEIIKWASYGINKIRCYNGIGDKGQVIKRNRSNDDVRWEGVVDIGTSGSNRCIGELWYNQNDGVMYLRIS